MGKHRTQLFLEEMQYQGLARLAGSQGVTNSEIVRRFVDQGLQDLNEDRDPRLNILRQATRLRLEIERRSGVYPGDPVADARYKRG